MHTVYRHPVARQSTNAFDVFHSQEAGHENHLTRALLVLLRLSPLAQQVWLRQIGLADLGLVGVGEPTYAFQTGTVPNVDPSASAERVRGISVFITKVPAYNVATVTAHSDRQIPDALISYPVQDTPIIVVVESKVREAADATQASEINLGGVRTEWDPACPVQLLWSDLIDELWSLLDLGAAGATEHRLLLDFFDFVDRHYHEVGPYSTLKRCGGISERIRRRCRTLLHNATGEEAHGPARGHGPYVEMTGPHSLPRRVGFELEEGSLRLSFWPADTPTQARAFYSDHELLERVLRLSEEPGWSAEPNMHFGHFTAGYGWLAVPDSTSSADYLAYWRDHMDRIMTVYRPPSDRDWDTLLKDLSWAGVIADREAFDRDFTQTKRTKADVRPGLRLNRVWGLHEAQQLDEDGQLVTQLRDAYQSVLGCFSALPKYAP